MRCHLITNDNSHAQSCILHAQNRTITHENTQTTHCKCTENRLKKDERKELWRNNNIKLQTSFSTTTQII